MRTSTPTGIYEFGPFRLDVPGNQLRRNGSPIDLSGLRWDLLVLLVEHHPAAVSEQALCKRLWAEENGNLLERLKDLVKNLRKDLAHEGSHEYIEWTRHHLSLTVGVRQVTASSEPPTGTRTRVYWSIALFAITAALITVGIRLHISLAWPRLPEDRLIVGLATFSPPTAQAENLRLRIKLALERREGGGPHIEVQLLDGQINASESDLLGRAVPPRLEVENALFR